MKKQRKTFFNKLTLRIPQYILGFTFLGLGVVLILRSRLGAGSWDATTANLSALLSSTLGIASFMINLAITIILVTSHKSFKYLLIVIPMILMSLSLDFWDILVIDDDFLLNAHFFTKLIAYLGGLAILSFGLAFIITSDFIAGTIDELMLLIMKIFKTDKTLIIRLSVEMFGILLALLFGYLASIGLGAVNVGSIIAGILLPPLLALHMKWLNYFIYEKNPS